MADMVGIRYKPKGLKPPAEARRARLPTGNLALWVSLPRCWLPLLVFNLLMGSLSARGADENSQNPARLTVEPSAVTLEGLRSGTQLVVTGHLDDGSLSDFTHACRYESSDSAIVLVSEKGVLTPVSDGKAVVRISSGAGTAEVSVLVSGADPKAGEAVSFSRHVIPTLTQAGCNAGACHGTPSGKNGFRLSLRGYLPDSDLVSLTHDMLGRRTNRLAPERSLILLKATGQVPHEGGKRFEVGSAPYRRLADWIAGGQPSDLEGARVERLEVWPERRILSDPCRLQQLAVRARFSDGSVRDVTDLAVFSSSDLESAEVSSGGLVTSHQMGEAAILVSYLDATAVSRLTFLREVPGFAWPDPPAHNYVDRHVFGKLRELRLPPSSLAADEVFLRRAYLDVLGVLPTSREARRFLADPSVDKRARLIDALLERPEYADFWSLKWADKLGCNNRFVGADGAYKYREWIRDAVARNLPFNSWVRQILTATGPNYSQPASGFYRRIRDPDSRVETTAQLFLGVRVQCARCHNHPFERWTQDDYFGLAAFFPRVKYKDGETVVGIYNKEEVVYVDRVGEVTHPRTGARVAPKFLGGSIPEIGELEDRRRVLAEWIVHPENPFFARTAVNRIWFHLLGRGIVHPVDDFRASNPPSNPALLDALADDFVAHGFDNKHIIRTIMNSRTYQLSSRSEPLNEHDDRYFSHAALRLLGAEQLLDAVSAVTGTPERFPGLPIGTRAAELPDGEYYHRFLRTFGQPQRSSACECEREGDSTLTQALHLIGGRTVHSKLQAAQGQARQLADSNTDDSLLIEELYLSTLSRFPTAEESKLCVARLAQATNRTAAVEDLLWALINSKEFLFQH